MQVSPPTKVLKVLRNTRCVTTLQGAIRLQEKLPVAALAMQDDELPSALRPFSFPQLCCPQYTGLQIKHFLRSFNGGFCTYPIIIPPISGGMLWAASEDLERWGPERLENGLASQRS
jgi:hypothetical protein